MTALAKPRLPIEVCRRRGSGFSGSNCFGFSFNYCFSFSSFSNSGFNSGYFFINSSHDFFGSFSRGSSRF